jgi:alcohol dehydrogenase class IV
MPGIDSDTYRLALQPERTRGTLPPSKSPHSPVLYNNCHISYGLPFHRAVAAHIVSTFNASRTYILASRTLANSTSALRDLQNVLGERVAGVKTGLKSHTSWDDVLAMKRECVELGVDVIVTLGGGSLSDAAKLLSLVRPRS